MRAWWAGKAREALDLGFDGFMEDLGEYVQTEMRFHDGRRLTATDALALAAGCDVVRLGIIWDGLERGSRVDVPRSEMVSAEMVRGRRGPAAPLDERGHAANPMPFKAPTWSAHLLALPCTAAVSWPSKR